VLNSEKFTGGPSCKSEKARGTKLHRRGALKPKNFK
jgi:hypothetical protein